MNHFSFPACRRIAHFFGLTYIPKYNVADILSEGFVGDLARKTTGRTNDLTGKTERLAQSLFLVFYKDGILALEIMVCGMLPPEKMEEPVVKNNC
jgi:hypothetical protein